MSKVIALGLVLAGFGVGPQVFAQRQMECLGRGVVATRTGPETVFVSWRLLGTDPAGLTFNLYRQTANGVPARLNAAPLAKTTDFLDLNANAGQAQSYFVRPLLNGQELPASRPFLIPAGAPVQPFLSVPLQTPPGYTPNDGSAGDLDGDGEYEIVLHQAGVGRDNSQKGRTDPPILEAYKLNGARLWKINLGKNVREGAHYTQFMVYDLDGDGRAEVACKTADGTVDGAGQMIGDPKADYRNADGYILDGPEFLTVFDGLTGRALATVPYLPPRGRAGDWGDNYGNRVDRFLACIAYLDGRRPSLVMCRGYYTRTVLAAWNWRDRQLAHLWTFDSHSGPPGNRAYAGQGNHGLSVADVDGDGRDEIIYGACAIDDNGQGLYSTGLGHGDALHVSDLDPDRPGLEVFGIHEKPRHGQGATFRDARTGQVLWSLRSADAGRGLSMDLDPRQRGYECWAFGEGLSGLYDCRGARLGNARPRSCNMGIWWDGDPLRELLDGTVIEKWDWEKGVTTRLLSAHEFQCARNNGTKANPVLCADLLGDWREEVVWRTADNRELRLFTTTLPAGRRLPTLMHDPVYRLSVAWQNVGYNQPTQTGFYLGEGMAEPPPSAISTNSRVAGAVEGAARRRIGVGE